MAYLDMTIVCGLTPDGGFDGVKETDWQHFGIPVKNGEIWEFQFQFTKLSGGTYPTGTVVGSFIVYDNKGVYRNTLSGAPVTDTNSWQRYSFQQQFTGDVYVFPAVWWHSFAALNARYLAAAQMASIPFSNTSVSLSALGLMMGPP